MEINDNEITRKGLMFVLSSPSGAGKTSLSRKLLELDKELFLSVSYTTRPPRPGEIDGEDYFFVNSNDFAFMQEQNEFLEYAKVFDYYYGTPKKPVKKILDKGRDILFDIDWQGTQQLMNNSKDDLVKVFVLPPSIEELERRLKERKQDKDEIIQKRMSKASDEMSHYAEYDYILVNDDFDKTKSGLKEVRSYIWLDLIMINISENELPFKKYIKPLEDRWSSFWTKEDQKMISHANDYGYFKLEAKCNWKFAIENYCESYHLPFVHPGLNAYSKIDDHYHIQGLPNRFAGQGTLVYNPRFKNNEKFPTFPGWSKEKEEHAEYVALFPNVMLGIHKDHYYAYWLEPTAHNFTIEHMEIYYVGEEAARGDKYKSLRKQNYDQWYSIQSEDLNIIEGMQAGRNSPVYNGGNFSPALDNPTHHFNKWVATSLIDNDFSKN